MKNSSGETAEICALYPDMPGTTFSPNESPAAPKHLTAEATAWWRKLTTEYALADEAGLLLLQTALEAFDRMKACQRKIKAEGMSVRDRFKQIRAHPLLSVERDARAALLSNLKALNLDIEPLRNGPGRPGGR